MTNASVILGEVTRVGVPMPIDPSEAAKIRQVSLRWTEAMRRADVEQLRQLMTEDVVVVHANGQTLAGRDAVAAHLARSLADFHIHQRVHSEETIVTNEWAFERSRVHTTMSPRHGGASRDFLSVTLTILRNDGLGWRVARTIGVIEQDD
jgi:uncharacterized protein (TIGR02246 family)